MPRRIQKKMRKPSYRRKLKFKTARRRTAKTNLRQQVHYFKRYVGLGLINADGTGNPQYGSLSFNLNQVPNVSEFTSLFDNYRISFVKLMFRLRTSPDAQLANNSAYPQMFIQRDYDDNTVPTSVNSVRESGRCILRTIRPDRYTVVKIRPATQNLVFNDTGSNTVFVPKWKQWLDMSYPGVPYYGIKYAVDTFSANTNNIIEIQAVYYFQCKDTR